MASKALLVLGLLLAAAALVSSEFIARELEDEKTAAKEAAGVMDQKYGGGYPGGGYPGGGYPGGGYPGGGYPGGGRNGGYPGGGYPGGGRNGGYPGGGYPGGRCRYGCCRRGYNGCSCCMHANDIPAREFLPEMAN